MRSRVLSCVWQARDPVLETFPCVKDSRASEAIAGTGFLVSFWNRRDQYHAWAVEIAEAITEPLLTCEAVLAETSFHLGDSAVVLEFVTEGLVRPDLIAADHIPRLTALAARYADQSPISPTYA